MGTLHNKSMHWVVASGVGCQKSSSRRRRSSDHGTAGVSDNPAQKLHPSLHVSTRSCAAPHQHRVPYAERLCSKQSANVKLNTNIKLRDDENCQRLDVI